MKASVRLVRGSVCLLLAALVVSSTPVRAGDDKEKDLKALVGTWEGMEGKKNTYAFTIEGDKWKLSDKNKDGLFLSGTFTILIPEPDKKDPEKKKPKEMTLKVTGIGTAKELDDLRGKTVLCIYDLSGDTLKWCAAEPGSENRPTDFSGKGPTLYVEFKRAK